jgi:hypothetical protein
MVTFHVGPVTHFVVGCFVKRLLSDIFVHRTEKCILKLQEKLKHMLIS